MIRSVSSPLRAIEAALLILLAAGCGSSARPVAQPAGSPPADQSAETVPLTEIAGDYLCAVGPAPSAGAEPSPTELPCRLDQGEDTLTLSTDAPASGWRLSGQATRTSAGLRLSGQLTDPKGNRTPITVDLYEQTSGFSATAVGTSGQLIEIDLRPATAAR